MFFVRPDVPNPGMETPTTLVRGSLSLSAAAAEAKVKLTMEAGALDDRIRLLTEMEKVHEGYSKAVKTVMREAGRGRIVNISSVAGVIAIPFQAYYSASKAAINSYTMALANEVRPFGVSVCAVMPGDIRTGFTSAREKLHAGDDIYGGRIGRSVSGMERDELRGMAPETAGRYICSLATRRRVKPLYAIGLAYKFFCFLERILPVRPLSWLVGLLYAK